MFVCWSFYAMHVLQVHGCILYYSIDTIGNSNMFSAIYIEHILVRWFAFATKQLVNPVYLQLNSQSLQSAERSVWILKLEGKDDNSRLA